jgi:hypothetical protein
MGNPTRIVYRSSWEFKAMMECDSDPNVVGWQSEEFFIWYTSPVDGKMHRYFPDLLVKRKGPLGIVETYVYEIKPANQTTAPKQGTKTRRRYVNEVFNYGRNTAKWEAAERWCAKRGYKFKVLTENELKVF